MRENKSELTTLGLIDYVTILMALIASGSAYFFLYHAGATMVMLFLISVLHLIAKPSHLKNNMFISIYSILIIINILMYGCPLTLIGDLIFFISSILIVISFPFEKFRRGFLEVTVIMAVLSIFLELLFIIGLIHPTLYGTGKNGLLGHFIFAFHTFGGGHLATTHKHLCGIFWEPGIYQIVLNLCLLYNLDLLEKDATIKKRKIKLTIILGAIVMTMSTTGYLCLGIILVGYFMEKAKASLVAKLIALMAICLFGLIILTNPVITEKFSTDNQSFLVRANDFLGLCKAIWIKPFVGLGVYSKTFEQVAANIGMTNSLSAGLLLQTAQFGILWVVSFFICAYQEFRKRNYKIPSYMFLACLTALGLTEPLAFTPIMLINALPFKNYKK